MPHKVSRDKINTTTGRSRCPPGRIIVVVTLIVLTAFAMCGGCINKIMQNSGESGPTPGITLRETPAVKDTAASPAASRISPVSQIPEITPVKSEVVQVVAPFMTPDPYPVIHATPINSTPDADRLNRNVEFEKSYHLTGGAEGLLVNVAEGPMYIVYVVSPQNDCLNDACRGTNEKPLQRPYLRITVRDNRTHEIIAQDGYGYEYSSDTGQQKISRTSTTADGSTETYNSPETPVPRYIPIYQEGIFHITIEGAYLDTKVKILTGPTLSRSTTQPGQGASTYSNEYTEEGFG